MSAILNRDASTADLQSALSILDPIIHGYEMVEPGVFAYAPEHEMRERIVNTRRAVERALLERLDLAREAIVTNADRYTR